MGILSLSKLNMLNLDKQFKHGLNLDENKVRVEFDCNSVSLSTESATRKSFKKQTDEKIENLCLFPADCNRNTFFGEGRSYYVRNENLDTKKFNPFSRLEWESPNQYNFFINSPMNVMEIRVVLDTQEKESGKEKSIVIAQQRVPLSDLSMYLEDVQAGQPNNFAIEFNYL